MFLTSKIGATAIKPSVHCSIRDVINCNHSDQWMPLESMSQLQPKRRLHSRLFWSLYNAKPVILTTENGPRPWSHKRICKPLKNGILNHQKQKQRLVEKNEKPIIVWRVLATLKQYFKYLPSQTSGCQRKPVYQSLAKILVSQQIFI